MVKLIWFSSTVLLILLSLTYIFFALSRGLSALDLPLFRLRLYSLIGTILLASPILLPGKWGRAWMIVLIHICVFLLLTQLFNFFIKHIYPKDIPLWTFLYRYSLIPLLGTAILMVYGYFNMSHIIRTEYTISTNKDIPAGGYTIALIADTHFENATTLPMIQTMMDQIRDDHPDLILLGGDLVDEHTSHDGMKSLFPVLGSIHPPLGTYYVYGNHDLQRYAASPTFTETELQQTIASSDIHILADHTVQLTDTLFLAGRRDRTMGQLPVKDLLIEADPADYILLLDHQPYDFHLKQQAGADLTLSGHTHAGQIFPAGMFTAGDLNYGEKIVDTLTAIVTSGASGWGFPIRTSKHSEYVILHIVKNNP